MEENHILFYLQTLHRSLHIPLVYMAKGMPLRSFQPFSASMEENESGFIFNRLKTVHERLADYHVMLLEHPRMILLGIVEDPREDTAVIVGPVSTTHANVEDIADYLFFTGLSSETTKQMAAYMNANKFWTAEMFKQLLLNINLQINGEMLSADQIGQIEDREVELRHKFNRQHFARESEEQEHRQPLAFQDFTDRLSYCLMHGDTISMGELLTDVDITPFSSESSPVPSQMKQVAYGSVFAAETIALKSGIPSANLKATKQYYLDRIDRAVAAEEYRRLSVGAMFDMAKCVREYLSEKTENPTIRRAVEYIKENLNTKLQAQDIAQAVHVSPHYLFTKFKQETGKTLTQFINEEKIKKACYYIVFTDNSFSEIANFLSFSSQSYFQTVFKKVMGQTPNEWKLSNRDISF